jgi:hypothetical protein
MSLKASIIDNGSTMLLMFTFCFFLSSVSLLARWLVYLCGFYVSRYPRFRMLFLSRVARTSALPSTGSRTSIVIR